MVKPKGVSSKTFWTTSTINFRGDQSDTETYRLVCDPAAVEDTHIMRDWSVGINPNPTSGCERIELRDFFKAGDQAKILSFCSLIGHLMKNQDENA